ncbi:unnamed protein product [Cuscuta epithymum]|uniref:RNase H type-1 domain-containing protein n=1 Tax=Cuscuta epithymum TaxID=186058 RepID=A0AAV0ET84_9ASTE|nr:unnamed protein product [Cuscuta epithymum]
MERNQRVCQKASQRPAQFMYRARAFVTAGFKLKIKEDAQRARCREEFYTGGVRPVDGRSLILMLLQEAGATGWAALGSQGRLRRISGRRSKALGESGFFLRGHTVGIREALNWLKENNWDFVEIESDATLGH